MDQQECVLDVALQIIKMIISLSVYISCYHYKEAQTPITERGTDYESMAVSFAGASDEACTMGCDFLFRSGVASIASASKTSTSHTTHSATANVPHSSKEASKETTRIPSGMLAPLKIDLRDG